MSGSPLEAVTSVKLKLGVLVGASVSVAAVVAALGERGGVPLWLVLPVTVALALAVTQLLAVGMTSPLREMTAAARRMARGDYAVQVNASSADEVGQLARAFNTMAADLASVDRERRELIANVSHELRTPLAALSAVLENAVDGVGDPDAATLRTALDQTERLAGLARDLLDLARTDAGTTALDVVDVPLADLVDLVVNASRSARPGSSYDVTITPPDLRVLADRGRLRQLLTNLVDNAARHARPDGRVSISAQLEGDRQWRLEVADDGPGIPEADRHLVFERFWTSRDGEDGGTGLGLAIARWVAQLHGGAIAVVDPGAAGGARLRVDLPLHPPISPEELTVKQPSSPAPAPVAVPLPLTEAMFGSFWRETNPRGSLRVVLAALAVGILSATIVPMRDHGLAVLLVLITGGGVVFAAAEHRRSPFTITCGVLCGLLAGTVIWRDAVWIVAMCLLAFCAVGLVGLVGARTVLGFVTAGFAWPLAGLRALPWFGRSLRPLGRVPQSGAPVRTIALSVAGMLVFGALFASADAIFAEWAGALIPEVDAGTLPLRTFMALFVGGLVLAAAYVGLNPPHLASASAVRPVVHRYEWLVPVLLVDAVFIVFLLAQATVIFGGEDYLRRTTGLTYAEYVHQGFGQMTVATALTLVVVAAAARKAPRITSSDRLSVRASLGVLCAATLIVVASALHRMDLYQDAYGFTRLRLLVDVFEGWLGMVVLMVMIAGIGLRGAWVPRAALLAGALGLLGLAVINPDAWIARHNLERYAETGKVDWDYLRGLSDDAVPALTKAPDDVRRCALLGTEPSDDDWLEWNLGRQRADNALESVEARAEITGCFE